LSAAAESCRVEKRNDTMPNPSSPKIILITGCSSGFGMLAAARLASRGHQVIATMRDLNRQAVLLSELNARGAEADILQMDVTDPFSIQEAVRYAGEKYGYIDILINNAGIVIGGMFEDLTQNEIRSVMETNFFGVQNVCRAVIPMMRGRQSGKIINLSSVSGFYGSPGFGAYNASKWALEGFSESLYYELKFFGIDVVLVEPAAYKTKIFGENTRLARNFENDKSPYYRISEFLKKRVDEGIADNHRDPEEVAALIERIADSRRPKLRYTTEMEGRFMALLKRLLPCRLFCWIYWKLLFKGLEPPNGQR
jgi:NAD(P)-dependent dehydrogenase (short-subunit alcohol dehydrogenase family)